jgi:hypothetical protein
VARAAAPADSITIHEQSVPIADIVRESALMMRVKQDDATVKKYAAAMAGGAVFPPIEIMEVDTRLLLTSGVHRTAAVELNGGTHILAHVRYLAGRSSRRRARGCAWWAQAQQQRQA